MPLSNMSNRPIRLLQAVDINVFNEQGELFSMGHVICHCHIRTISPCISAFLNTSFYYLFLQCKAIATDILKPARATLAVLLLPP